MKINGNAIRPGNIIEHQNRLWVAVKIQHTQPGKGGAYLQVELKDIRSGTKLNERFRSSESVERVRLEDKDYQFLYNDGDDYTLMDQETFDQVVVRKELIGEPAVYLQEGMIVLVSSYEGDIVSVSVPDSVVCVVEETEPALKGQTAASSYKPAIMNNKVRVMVPPHISIGDRLVINTADNTYIERAKS